MSAIQSMTPEERASYVLQEIGGELSKTFAARIIFQLEQAVLAEREACAEIAEKVPLII
jgi:hypothetical protein